MTGRLYTGCCDTAAVAATVYWIYWISRYCTDWMHWGCGTDWSEVQSVSEYWSKQYVLQP